MTATLPKMVRVRQRTDGPVVDDVAAAVEDGLTRQQCGRRIKPGDTVAITGGSRGISNIAMVLRATVEHVRNLGGDPFLVPAMGSHGGATAEGQRKILESYGMTEEAIGCRIEASMETIEVDRSKYGFPLWQGTAANQADHLIVCNRVKPHTLFAGPVESGLVKMLMIGVGKRDGAATYHRAVMEHGWPAIVEDVAPRLLEQTNVLAGIALVERSDERTAHVEVVPPEQWLTTEPALLQQAKRLLPKLPFADVDLLLLDQIGKNISGAGLDTNVVGRKDVVHPPTHHPTRGVRFIAARALTPESGGNAIGIGLVEFARTRLLRQMDPAITRLNALTAGDVPAAMLPIDFETDREIIETALPMIGLRDPAEARIVWARNTLDLTETLCSTAFLAEAGVRDDIELVGNPIDLPFDAGGNLPDDLADTRPS